MTGKNTPPSSFKHTSWIFIVLSLIFGFSVGLMIALDSTSGVPAGGAVADPEENTPPTCMPIENNNEEPILAEALCVQHGYTQARFAYESYLYHSFSSIDGSCSGALESVQPVTEYLPLGDQPLDSSFVDDCAVHTTGTEPYYGDYKIFGSQFVYCCK